MNILPLLLAQTEPLAPATPWQWSNLAVRERVMIFGALGLVTLGLVFWAVFIRKKRHRHHSHHHHHHHHHRHYDSARVQEAPEEPQTENASSQPERRHHRWRRRRHHRPRNPTLAETGGLPPIRQESPPDAEP